VPRVGGCGGWRRHLATRTRAAGHPACLLGARTPHTAHVPSPLDPNRPTTQPPNRPSAQVLEKGLGKLVQLKQTMGGMLGQVGRMMGGPQAEDVADQV
jgi:hypothetical protein